MVNWAIVLFLITASGGLILATQRLRSRPLSLALALVHGGMAVLSIGLLALAIMMNPVGTLTAVSLALFLFVALGGVMAFSYHMRNDVLPLWLLALHAGAAVCTVLLLIYSVYGNNVVPGA